jgi:N-acetylneuraminate synthase/sialic acid synthase
MGKQLVASRPLPAGHVLAAGDLVAKSPDEGGVPPYRLDELLGRRLVRPLADDEAIRAEDVGDDVAGDAVASGSTAAV